MNEVFISYVQGDQPIVKALSSRLESYDIKQTDISDAYKTGCSFFAALREVISKQRYFITLITENYIKSGYAFEQYNEVVRQALRRDKTIISIIPEKLKDHETVGYFLENSNRVLYTEEKFSPEILISLSKEIRKIINQIEKKQYLFEKLAEFKRFKKKCDISETLNELVFILLNELDTTVHPVKRRTIIKQLALCLKELSENNEEDFGAVSQRSTTYRIHALNSMKKLEETSEFQNTSDLFFLALQIYLINLESKIRSYCRFINSKGEINRLSAAENTAYSEKQYQLLDTFVTEKLEQNVSYLNPRSYSDNEVTLILNINDYLLANQYYDQEILLEGAEPQKKRTSSSSEMTKVAQDLLKSTNELKSLFSNKITKASLKMIRASYERIKEFAETIGATDICLQCIDEIARINAELESTLINDLPNDKMTRAIKSLMGLTLSDIGPFDVFLSHGEADTDIAYNLYHYLKGYLKTPFLDIVDLPEMFPAELNKSVMAAIQNSENFVVVASELANLKEKKVKVEMDSFHYKKILENKKNSKFILVLTDDLYEQVEKSNREILDEKYKNYDIIKISSDTDYKDQILSLLK